MKTAHSKRHWTVGVLCCGMLLIMNAFPPAGIGDEKQPTDEDIIDLSIEELMNVTVYGASKFDQKLSDAPASVTIITADEIRKYGYRTLADMLRSVRGFYATNDRNYSYVGARGFNRPGDFNTRILLLVDGHRTNDNIYDQAFIGMAFILDIDLVERVEIIRGPSSSLYGSNALFGVINVITRSGGGMGGAEMSGEIGTSATNKERVSYGRKFRNGVELVASGSRFDSDGNRSLYYPEFDDPATNNGVARKVDDESAQNYFVKGAFGDFTLEAAGSAREKGVPTGAYGTEFNVPQTRTTDARAYAFLKYARVLSGGWDVMARLYYDRYEYNGDWVYYDPLVGAPPSFRYLNRDESRGEWWGGEAQVTKKLRRHTLTVGAEYQDNVKQDQKNFNVDPFSEYADSHESVRTALFAQDEYAISRNLIFNAGVRYDHYETFSGEVRPRMAVIYSPLKSATLKALYSEAFRAPTASEQYYQDEALTLKANPDLRPEVIKTYELVYEQYLGASLRMTAVGYYYTMQDLITQDADPADLLLVYQNLGRARAKGVEFELEGKWMNGYAGRVSYALQRAEDAATGEPLSNSPRHLAKANVIAPLVGRKVYGSFEVQYTGKRKTEELFQGAPKAFAEEDAAAFYLTNLTLIARNITAGLDLSASVYNLLDTKYGDPGSGEHPQNTIEQDGRTFRIKLVYAF